MKRALHYFLHIFILFSLFTSRGLGQQNVPVDTAIIVIQPIPFTNIIIEATEVNTLLREKRTGLLSDIQKVEIETWIDSLKFRLAIIREDSRVHQLDELSLRSLENLQSEWTFLKNLFSTEQQNQSVKLQSIENQTASISNLLAIWERTSETVQAGSAPALVIEQINTTLQDIRATQAAFASDSRFLQEKLVRIASGVILTNEVIEDIERAKIDLTRSLLSIGSPPIWKEFISKKDTTIVFQSERSLIDDSILELRDFWGQYAPWIWFHIFFSILIIIAIFVIYRNLRHSIPESDTPEIAAVKKITERPLVSGLLIAIVLTFILYRNIPDTVLLLTAILLLSPVYFILRAVITGPARNYIILPLVAIIMVELHTIGYSETLFSRLWLVFINLFSIAVLALIAGMKSRREILFEGRYGKLLSLVGFITFGLMVIAFFANILGAITLAEFLTDSVIESIVISMFLFALVATLNSIITTSIQGNYLKRSIIFREYKELIHNRLKSIINVIAFYLLINFTLRIFNIWGTISTWVKGVFTHPIKIGPILEFSLWSIVLFLLIIWLTIRISRLISTILEGESGLRERMRKGVPGALSLLLRITIFTIGFLVAVAAAGVKMDKLAILLGAFGVGIGFGLQNIFNNLVSGIILAFERPIKEGDIIEVNALLGIVKEIGIRSSVIRTYDGSEVIVPNGNLISNDLINWTRSDMRRRGEVLVGVAYGTDPQKVIDLLLETAKNNANALEEPPPVAIFKGFGDSSLDFRLTFWIADAEHRLIIQSEMAVQVNKAIVDAGITIPFPQRDLHVKSMDPHMFDRIKAQDEISKQQGHTT